MRIHGTFLNSAGLAVTVEIITRRDTLTSIEIGSDEAGLWFPASEAFTTEAGDHRLPRRVLPAGLPRRRRHGLGR